MQARTGRSACERKFTYDTPEEAQPHLDALWLLEPFQGHHIYRCNQCGLYHLSGGPRHTYRDDGKPKRGRNRRLANE